MISKGVSKFLADLLNISTSGLKYVSDQKIIESIANAQSNGSLSKAGNKMAEIALNMILNKK